MKKKTNQNQNQIILRFFSFINLYETLQTKEKRQELDWSLDLPPKGHHGLSSIY